MITIDASVLVAAAMSDEPAHPAALAVVARVRDTGLALHQPAIALVEVTSGIARRTGDPVLAQALGEALLAIPNLTIHVLDADAAIRAATLAGGLRLRGADAVYAATALAAGSTLLTVDTELIERAAGAVSVMSPEVWLARGDLEVAYSAATSEASADDAAAWDQTVGDGLEE